MKEPVQVDDDPRGFRRILLDRGETRNAIDSATVRGLRAGIADAPGVVVILGSVTPTAFSSGADLKLNPGSRAQVSNDLYRLYQEMRESDKILITAASGPAVGGGAQLLVASDLRLASPDVEIRFLGPGHGLVVGAWGLPSLIGRGRAMDLCLSMRTVRADEALAIGLVDRLVDDPLDEAARYAAEICELDPEAVVALKRVISISDTQVAPRTESAPNAGWDGAVR